MVRSFTTVKQYRRCRALLGSCAVLVVHRSGAFAITKYRLFHRLTSKQKETLYSCIHDPAHLSQTNAQHNQKQLAHYFNRSLLTVIEIVSKVSNQPEIDRALLPCTLATNWCPFDQLHAIYHLWNSISNRSIIGHNSTLRLEIIWQVRRAAYIDKI